MKHLRYITFFVFLCIVTGTYAQDFPSEKQLWKQVRREMPGFRKVFRKHKKYRVEIVYTRVIHDPVNGNVYERYRFGDAHRYFYPASTVKFPMALAAYQKLENLLSDSLVFTENTCITPAGPFYCGRADSSYLAHKYVRIKDSMGVQQAAALGGLSREVFCSINRLDPLEKIAPGTTVRLTPNPVPLTLNEMMNEMLLYSNNHYFNWLFEFAQDQLESGANGILIRKRLMPCTGPDTLHTRPLLLIQENRPPAKQPPVAIAGVPALADPSCTVGKKHYDFEGKLVNRGRNFSAHNRISLEALQDQLINLVYPGYLRTGAFHINEEHRINLIRYMGMLPSEDRMVSDSAYLSVPDDFTNFLYTGQNHQPLPDGLRIVNVIGQAYGFVTDCAYFADEKNRIDYFLAVRIYVNRDGVLNDDRYEYEETAYPFMEQLGRVMHRLSLSHQQDSGARLIPVFQIFR